VEQLKVAEIGWPERTDTKAAPESWRTAPLQIAGLLRFWWSRLAFPGQDTGSDDWGRGLWLGMVVLLFIAGPLLFWHLSYPLLEPDEGRYAEIPREMLASGDWIVPTLNGRPFYDKPPLFYWLVAVNYQLFGLHDWVARLVPAGAALLTVLVVFGLGRRAIGNRPAFLAALALALTIAYMQIGRVVILDSLLTLFVTAALLTAQIALRGQRRVSWNWWLASAVCAGLGVLAKGPIALVLFGPPLVVFGWLNRDCPRPTLRQWLTFAGLVCCLAAPWYIAIIARDLDFARHFFIDQHLARFMYKYHSQPFWYYVPVLLIGCLPWSFLLLPYLGFLGSRAADLRRRRTQSLGF
jgi:dolichol-phosphate mannosyltransferase